MHPHMYPKNRPADLGPAARLTDRTIPSMLTQSSKRGLGARLVNGPTRTGGMFMTERTPEVEMEEGILRLLELRQKMNRHQEALLKSDQRTMDHDQKELFKLDHQYGMTRQRLFYGRSKEYAQDLLALLRKKKEEYARHYADAFDDLLVQVLDYVAGYDRSGPKRTPGSTAEELTLEENEME
jgi:hypothetical protein